MARDLYDVIRDTSDGRFIKDVPDFRQGRPVVVTAKVIGIPELFKKLKVYDKKLEAAGVRGVEKAVKHLLEKTLEVTPIDKGVLRSAGNYHVRKAGRETRGIVYFDDTIAPYAIYVHEDLSKYHKPPTMAKFLQRTHYKERGNMTRIVAEELRKVRP